MTDCVCIFLSSVENVVLQRKEKNMKETQNEGFRMKKKKFERCKFKANCGQIDGMCGSNRKNDGINGETWYLLLPH